jgi:hypothetical protein
VINKAMLDKLVDTTRKVMELPAQVEVGKAQTEADMERTAQEQATLALAKAKLSGRT